MGRREAKAHLTAGKPTLGRRQLCVGQGGVLQRLVDGGGCSRDTRFAPTIVMLREGRVLRREERRGEYYCRDQCCVEGRL